MNLRNLVIGIGILAVVLVAGIGLAFGSGKVSFPNEKQAREYGFVVDLDQKVTAAGQELSFEKVFFDNSSISFAIKGPKGGLKETKEWKLTDGSNTVKGQGDTGYSPGATIKSGWFSEYYVVSVNHLLPLKDQKIYLQVPGAEKIELSFPGNKLNEMTKTVNFSELKAGKDLPEGMVIFGIGYTVANVKGDIKAIFVKNGETNTIIPPVSLTKSGAEGADIITGVYSPLPIPRENPSIDVTAQKRAVLVTLYQNK